MEESLRSVNLFNGGVGDKQAGKYSGGMKRRLSVAISLIGDPKVRFNLHNLYFAAESFLNIQFVYTSTS